MNYEYRCTVCENRFDVSFRMGQAEASVPCPDCQGTARRSFDGTAIVFKGGGFPSSDMKFKREMTKRNEVAGERMRKYNKPPVRRVATDYGNGDVREAGK